MRKKHAMDVVEARTLILLEPHENERRNMVRRAMKAAAADMCEESPWFARQMELASRSSKTRTAYSGIDQFGKTALQEVLFGLAMLFIDSGLSDEQLERATDARPAKARLRSVLSSNKR